MSAKTLSPHAAGICTLASTVMSSATETGPLPGATDADGDADGDALGATLPISKRTGCPTT